MDLVMWVFSAGRQQLNCNCQSRHETDLVFGEPRYDPDATVLAPALAAKEARKAEEAAKAQEAAKAAAEARKAEETAQIEAAELLRPLQVFGEEAAKAEAAARAARAPEEAVSGLDVKLVDDDNLGAAAEPSDEGLKNQHYGQDSVGPAGPQNPTEQKAATAPADDAESMGLLHQCQGLWYYEDGQKIGTVTNDRIIWCEHTFESSPSKLSATSDVGLTMELDGELHSATFENGPQQKLVWSDGEIWIRG